jgi:hypothetical protein
MPPHLIIMDKVVLLGVIFKKMKCVCKTQMMPLPDHQNPVDMQHAVRKNINFSKLCKSIPFQIKNKPPWKHYLLTRLYGLFKKGLIT